MGTYLVILAILTVGCWLLFGKRPPHLRKMRAFRVKVTPDSASDGGIYVARCVAGEVENGGSYFLIACYDPTEFAGSDRAMDEIRRVFANNGAAAVTVEFSNPRNTPAEIYEAQEKSPPTILVTKGRVQVLGPESVWMPRVIRSPYRDGFLTYFA